MPGIAAKVFVHVQDWQAVIACPIAVVEVFALADAIPEVLLAAAAAPAVPFAVDATPEINCEEEGVVLNLRNDNLVRLKKFEDKSTSPATALNAATVTAELLDPDDREGTPLVAPVTLPHDGGTDGTYEVTWDKALLSPGGNDLAEGEYILRYIAVEGAINLEKDVWIEVRLREEDIND